jgi:tetratricopeptide (TPR) repeat protein
MVLLLAASPAGCTVQKLIRHGDSLLSEGEYAQAIEQYEEALRVSPGHAEARGRIRSARREAVRARLQQADDALAAGRLATALRHALRARHMPLDLEAVDLVQRIDSTITKSASLAEARVDELARRGHFASAVELSQAIVMASPGVASREAWGAAVRSRAQSHFVGLASTLAEKGLHGSAAIQLAFAHELGGDVAVDDVREQWNRFAEPTCFGEPIIEVVDETGKAKELVAKIEATARAELASVRRRCGEGNRELAVRIDLSAVDLKDETTNERHAQPLPGVEIETEEVYVEEVPYTETERYTEYETRVEKQEKRDCAPRPGKPRGCRTWFEEVEIRVPITRTREVQKVRKVRKTRPISDPLPEDKVLSFDVTRVSRAVTYEGTVAITGAATASRGFEINETSEDRGNERAEAKGLVVEADPLEVEPMAVLIARAAEAVADEIEADVERTVQGWAEAYARKAHEQVLSGQLPQAEELYLKLLALGVPGRGEMRAFFEERYGKPVEDVMEILAAALGRGDVPRDDRQGKKGKELFPSRGVRSRQPPGEAREATVAETKGQARARAAAQEDATKTGISDEELRALEEASIDALEAPASSGEEQSGDGVTGERIERSAPDAGLPEKEAPTRRPIPLPSE